ncbi:unnamed protein product [Rotaria magnacalcarata]|uniref:BEN domain-containing protein n=1 Tax=Rotaria magnacalcarata TaxID=392030 RepID=A0A820G2K4_9BILA|nr:unnamed protein product [Rotaria magnacalcarata]CAF4270955.1 unnamed protein product [Rotaria magnacalcarata]
MAFDPRTKRHIKKKVIYSPSDPVLPEYYLIYIDKFNEDFIVKKSSIKEQSNGKVLISIGGTDKDGEIITSGTKSHCETEFSLRLIGENQDEADDDIDSIENDSSIHFMTSSARKNVQSYSKTPQPPRAKLGATSTSPHSYSNSHNHDNNMHRSQSDIQLYHKSPPPNRKNNKEKDEESELEADEENDEEISGEVSKMIDSRVDNRIHSLLTSVNKKLDFVTKKLRQVSQISGFGESQLAIYRNEKDKFQDKVMHHDENSLNINGKNPGDYGRRLLRVLFTDFELKTCMLPSTVGNRYLKPKLDAKQFALLNTAIRVKYRINAHHYEDFYKHLVRKKLSDFLLEEERRDTTKAKRLRTQQQETDDTSASTTISPTQIPILNLSATPVNDKA